MLYAVVKIGKIEILPINQSFTLGDYQYPANWLALSNSEHRASLNIYPVVKDKLPPHQRYNIITENPPVWDAIRRCVQISYTSEPMSLEQIQKLEIEKLQFHCSTLLSFSDKMILGAHDHGSVVDQKWIDHRAAVHAETNRLIDGINNASNSNDVFKCLTSANWPQKP